MIPHANWGIILFLPLNRCPLYQAFERHVVMSCVGQGSHIETRYWGQKRMTGYNR
jgi:hypothetical protein